MTIYYLDTSALSKRYIVENGTEWVRDLVASSANNTIVISDLTPIEIFSVFQRKESAGIITTPEANDSRNGFLMHYATEYLSILLSNPVLERARRLVTTHKKLRTLDAIQLASALESVSVFGQTVIFVSADKVLNAAAILEGFRTDNPDN